MSRILLKPLGALRRRTRFFIVKTCLVVFFALSAWYAPILYAHLLHGRRYIVNENIVKNPGSLKVLLLILRMEERQRLSDSHLPYAGSLLAVYHRMDDGIFCLKAGPYPCRSTSTAVHRPIEEDVESVKVALERDGYYHYGYLSVPPGLYTLRPVKWRTEDPAFLLSEWGTFSGHIFLSDQQTLIPVQLVNQESSEKLVPATQGDAFDLKTGCYLHPSPVVDWDHRGSHGCITLLKRMNSDEDQYYDLLVAEITRLGAMEKYHLMGLAILTEEQWCIPKDSVSRNRFPEKLDFAIDATKGRPIPRITIPKRTVAGENGSL